MPTIWDYVNSVTHNKKDLWDNLTSESEYDSFMINRALSMFPDTILYAQEMNRNPHVSKKHNYYYYINSLRPSKRFSKWPKKVADDDLDAVKEYYGYNTDKAKTALGLLSPQQLMTIKKRLEKGGR